MKHFAPAWGNSWVSGCGKSRNFFLEPHRYMPSLFLPYSLAWLGDIGSIPIFWLLLGTCNGLPFIIQPKATGFPSLIMVLSPVSWISVGGRGFPNYFPLKSSVAPYYLDRTMQWALRSLLVLDDFLCSTDAFLQIKSHVEPPGIKRVVKVTSVNMVFFSSYTSHLPPLCVFIKVDSNPVFSPVRAAGPWLLLGPRIPSWIRRQAIQYTQMYNHQTNSDVCSQTNTKA